MVSLRITLVPKRLDIDCTFSLMYSLNSRWAAHQSFAGFFDLEKIRRVIVLQDTLVPVYYFLYVLFEMKDKISNHIPFFTVSSFNLFDTVDSSVE